MNKHVPFILDEHIYGNFQQMNPNIQALTIDVFYELDVRKLKVFGFRIIILSTK